MPRVLGRNDTSTASEGKVSALSIAPQLSKPDGKENCPEIQYEAVKDPGKERPDARRHLPLVECSPSWERRIGRDHDRSQGKRKGSPRAKELRARSRDKEVTNLRRIGDPCLHGGHPGSHKTQERKETGLKSKRQSTTRSTRLERLPPSLNSDPEKTRKSPKSLPKPRSKYLRDGTQRCSRRSAAEIATKRQGRGRRTA